MLLLSKTEKKKSQANLFFKLPSSFLQLLKLFAVLENPEAFKPRFVLLTLKIRGKGTILTQTIYYVFNRRISTGSFCGEHCANTQEHGL